MAGTGLLLLPLPAGAGKLLSSPVGRNRLRPPGAVPEEIFAGKCIRCGRCVEVCPYRSIIPLDIKNGVYDGTPLIFAETIPCYLCMKCVKVCPTGTLQKISQQETRMGLAIINRHRCYNWQEETLKDVLSRGRRMISHYCMVSAKRIHPKLVEVETEIEDNGLRVKCIIDVVGRLGITPRYADMSIIDYKVVKRRKSLSDVTNSLQLAAYSIAMRELVEMHKTETPRIAFCSLEKVTLKSSIQSCRVVEQMQTDFWSTAHRVAKLITNGDFPRCDPKHPLCSPNWCGFYQGCVRNA